MPIKKPTKTTSSLKQAPFNGPVALTPTLQKRQPSIRPATPPGTSPASLHRSVRKTQCNSAAKPDSECNMIRLHCKAEKEFTVGAAPHQRFKGVHADVFLKQNRCKCNEIYMKTMKFNFTANVYKKLPKHELLSLFEEQVAVPPRIGEYVYYGRGEQILPGYVSNKEHRHTGHIEFKYRRERSVYTEGEYIVMNVHLSPRDDAFFDRTHCALRFEAAFKLFKQRCASPVMRAMEALTQNNFKTLGFSMSRPSDMTADDERNAYQVALDRSDLAEQYSPKATDLLANALTDGLNKAKSARTRFADVVAPATTTAAGTPQPALAPAAAPRRSYADTANSKARA